MNREKRDDVRSPSEDRRVKDDDRCFGGKALRRAAEFRRGRTARYTNIVYSCMQSETGIMLEPKTELLTI